MAIAAAAILFPTTRSHHRASSILRPLSHPQQSLFLSFTHKPSSPLTHPHNAPTPSPSPINLSSKTPPNDFLPDEVTLFLQPTNQTHSSKFVFWVLLWTSLSLVFSAVVRVKAARAAADSIRASTFGLKVATALRSSGWADEAVVFALATLPIVELRGAIPVGYWLHLNPFFLTLLSVLGNMVPVPFIVLYLKRLASFLAQSTPSASRFLDILFERAREKAAPVVEFQWLGLMLFVAVPFPGTGAWTGAIIASILDMPFWSAVSANFCGVVLAGLLVNLLVNLGLKHAIIAGFILFFISTFMWTALRNLKKSLGSSN